MTFSFNAASGLIVVEAEIEGPSRSAIARLAIDTGATKSMLNLGILAAVGCEVMLPSKQLKVTTASGVENATTYFLDRITALSRSQVGFEVIGLTLPPSVGVDRLLGLDFFRRHKLTIDFANGLIHFA